MCKYNFLQQHTQVKVEPHFITASEMLSPPKLRHPVNQTKLLQYLQYAEKKKNLYDAQGHPKQSAASFV